MTGSDAATPKEDPVLAQAVSKALDSDPAQTAVLVQLLRRRVHDPETLLDLMGRVSREAVNILDGVRWAGVTAQLTDRPFTAAISDQRTLLIDHEQYENNDGPCITAMRTDSPVRMTLTEVAAVWPVLAETAARVGVHSFLAVPLHSHRRSVGSLNLYSADATAPTGDLNLLAVLTAYLDRGLTDYTDRRPGPAGETDLRTTLANWAVVEQAVGALMAFYGFSADYARDQLVDQAADSHRSLAAHATTVLAHSSGSTT